MAGSPGGGGVIAPESCEGLRELKQATSSSSRAVR